MSNYPPGVTQAMIDRRYEPFLPCPKCGGIEARVKFQDLLDEAGIEWTPEHKRLADEIEDGFEERWREGEHRYCTEHTPKDDDYDE